MQMNDFKKFMSLGQYFFLEGKGGKSHPFTFKGEKSSFPCLELMTYN